jgi:hypothetical protein
MASRKSRSIKLTFHALEILEKYRNTDKLPDEEEDTYSDMIETLENEYKDAYKKYLRYFKQIQDIKKKIKERGLREI